MFIHNKPSGLIVDINNITFIYPIINSSFKYTLWVLAHKYNNIKAIGTLKMPMKEFIDNNIRLGEKFDINKYKDLNISYIKLTTELPNIIPNKLLDINNIKQVVSILHIDSWALLHGKDKQKQLLKLLANNEIYYKYKKRKLSYFDYYLVYVSLYKKELVDKYLNNKYLYLLNGIHKNTFNDMRAKVKPLFEIYTKRQKLKRGTKINIRNNIDRDYYTTQLNDLIYLILSNRETLKLACL